MSLLSRNSITNVQQMQRRARNSRALVEMPSNSYEETTALWKRQRRLGHPLPRSREISSVCQSNLALRRAPQQQQKKITESPKDYDFLSGLLNHYKTKAKLSSSIQTLMDIVHLTIYTNRNLCSFIKLTIINTLFSNRWQYLFTECFLNDT